MERQESASAARSADLTAPAMELMVGEAFSGYAASRSAAAMKRSHAEMMQGDGTGATPTCTKEKSPIDDAAKKSPAAILVPPIDEKAWKATLKDIPRCIAVEGIRETSVFCSQPVQGGGGGSRNHCLRKLLNEIGSLSSNLPTSPGIFIRFDCETPQFLRALITAPTGTPYALGLFCFDVYIPDSYPSSPPKFHLLTTGNGTVRFSPNLNADGKVCLSS